MSQPALKKPAKTYLVPTIKGAEYVVASNHLDQHKKLLLCLLRGDAMELLMKSVGLPDRKALGALLFKMQREGWLSGESRPIRLSREPLTQSLAVLLEALSSQNKGILADHLGCCVANTGYSKSEADKISAFGTGLYPIHKRYTHDTDVEKPGLEVSLKCGTDQLAIRHLHIGPRLYHLALAGEFRDTGNQFVNLVTRLVRRCPGELTCE
jgi:hypothetical protein